ARRGFRPVVIEANSGPVEKVGECLSPSANPILEEFGLSAPMRADGHLRTHGNRSVWGSATPVEQDFLFGFHGAGWHLDRQRFEALLAAAAREAGADWRYNSSLCAPCRHDGGWALEVETPAGRESLAADFAIDATGRRSCLARRLGVGRAHID